LAFTFRNQKKQKQTHTEIKTDTEFARMYPQARQSRLIRNQNLTRVETAVQAGPISVSFMLIALVVLLSLLYLNQVSKASTLNYRVSTLEAKRTALQAEKEQLRIDAARLQSIAEARNSQVASAMAPVGNVTYAQR
jgi:hypothetical protein